MGATSLLNVGTGPADALRAGCCADSDAAAAEPTRAASAATNTFRMLIVIDSFSLIEGLSPLELPLLLARSRGPTPRSARQAHSLPLVRAVYETASSVAGRPSMRPASCRR